MTDNRELCGFEWNGPCAGGQLDDVKDHQCVAPKDHDGCHECDCGTLKYAGPDPTAWRKKKRAATKEEHDGTE